MYQIRSYSPGGPVRYSAKNTSKPVNFVCIAPRAQSVMLVGDFNDWDPTAHPLWQRPDGAWFLQVSLRHGHHHYQFLVDGELTLDPKAHGVARNRNGEKVSLVSVS